MNFLQRLKNEIYSDRNHPYRIREKVLVNERCLIELIEHFESMDSELRLISEIDRKEVGNFRKLELIIRDQWYKNNKSFEKVMFLFTDVMRDIMKDEDAKILRGKRFFE